MTIEIKLAHLKLRKSHLQDNTRAQEPVKFCFYSISTLLIFICTTVEVKDGAHEN